MIQFGKITAILAVSFLGMALFCAGNVFAEAPPAEHDPIAIEPPKDLWPSNLIVLGTPETRADYIFIADKDKRTLTVWSTQSGLLTLQGAYPMDIGKNGGPKVASGDQKTPEGVYFIEEKKEGPGLSFSEYGKRAFTLDYPNIFDRKDRKTGHGIWLHSIPETKSLRRGSRGCVVIRNEINDKVAPLIRVGHTPVIISEKVEYVSPAEHKKLVTSFNAWLDKWRASWESKDLDAYMAFYGDDFYANRMTKEKWRIYKQGLNEKYESIKVQVKDPIVLKEKNKYVMRFIQHYESSGLKDLGEKTIYVEQLGEHDFRIMSELWKPLSPELLAGQHENF